MSVVYHTSIRPRVFLEAFCNQYLDIKTDIGTDIGGTFKEEFSTDSVPFKGRAVFLKGDVVMVSVAQDKSSKNFLKILKGDGTNVQQYVIYIK